MALSELDREWVKLISKEVAFAVNKEVTIQHIENCPHGKKIVLGKWLVAGIFIGCAVASGLGAGGVLALAKIFVGI